MARPQVADEVMGSNTEGSCEYIEKSVAYSRQGVVLRLGGLGEMPTNPHRKNWPCHESDACVSDLD